MTNELEEAAMTKDDVLRKARAMASQGKTDDERAKGKKILGMWDDEDLVSKAQKIFSEAKATGEESYSADPVTPAGGFPKKRLADKNISVDPNADEIEDTVKTPQGKHDVGLKEAVEGLFEGMDLSEDFKSKTFTIFEAAVNERVATLREQIETEVETEMAEQVSSMTEELIEKVDSYLDYVIENWMKENEVAIESNLKVQVAESLINNIKGLVESHNIEITEEEVDAIEESRRDLEEAVERYNELAEEVMNVRREKAKLEREIAFRTVTEGLTDVQVERLRTLSEGISYEDTRDYASKLETIKESYFTEASIAKSDDAEVLNESNDNPASQEVVNPAIAAYMAAISRVSK